MIQAYEIGIKLALQDGVSEGIAAIRRDLGSLDVAIIQTTLRLAQLQRIGAQALSSTQEQPERVSSGALIHKSAPVILTPTPTEPEPAPAVARSEAPVVLPVQGPLQRAPSRQPMVATAAPARVGEAGPVSAPAVVRPDTVPAAAARLPAVADAGRPTIGPQSPELPVAAPLANTLPSASSPAAASITRLVAPTLQTGGALSVARDPAPERSLQGAAKSRPTTSASTGIAPQETRPESEGRARVRQAVHRPAETRDVTVSRLAPALDHSVARLIPAAARPDAVASPQSSMAPPASSSYAPPAVSPRIKESSMRGDVFLDGAQVGRWMSEQMARDAGRPNTGPTGFDPRRSPAWPGAAVTW